MFVTYNATLMDTMNAGDTLSAGSPFNVDAQSNESTAQVSPVAHSHADDVSCIAVDTIAPHRPCGLASIALGSGDGLFALLYRAYIVLQHTFREHPGSLYDPRCWWTLSWATWDGDAALESTDDPETTWESTLASWLPEWAQPWLVEAEEIIAHQLPHDRDGKVDASSLAAYVPSSAILSDWINTGLAHGRAVATVTASSLRFVFEGVTSAGTVFFEFTVAFLFFVNILYYLLLAPKPWLQVILSAHFCYDAFLSTHFCPADGPRSSAATSRS